MWVFLSQSFLSIVVDKQSAQDNLLVRARRKGDIERVFPGAKVSTTPSHDYRFRASISRQQVAAAIADEVSRIGYSNFKDSVPKGQHERHNAYLRVWSVMEGFQRAAATRRRTTGGIASRGAAVMTPKAYVIRKMQAAKGDDLERAKTAFRGMPMDELYGQSGMTRQQLLDQWQAERDEWQAAMDWLKSLP